MSKVFAPLLGQMNVPILWKDGQIEVAFMWCVIFCISLLPFAWVFNDDGKDCFLTEEKGYLTVQCVRAW